MKHKRPKSRAKEKIADPRKGTARDKREWEKKRVSRGEPSRAWLYGTHAVLAALGNPRRRCQRLLATAEANRGLGKRLEILLRARGDLQAPEITTREKIGSLLPPEAVHQGIALSADPLPEPSLEDLCRDLGGGREGAVVVLDQVTDPQNVGAVVRSVAAFGGLAVVQTVRHAPAPSAALAKAACGALEQVPLIRVGNLARAMATLKEAGFWCVGLDMEAERTLAEAKPGRRIAFVLGAEGRGLRRLTREKCDMMVRIPLGGPAGTPIDSLNVSAAAAIALYELARRR